MPVRGMLIRASGKYFKISDIISRSWKWIKVMTHLTHDPLPTLILNPFPFLCVIPISYYFFKKTIQILNDLILVDYTFTKLVQELWMIMIINAFISRNEKLSLPIGSNVRNACTMVLQKYRNHNRYLNAFVQKGKTEFARLYIPQNGTDKCDEE